MVVPDGAPMGFTSVTSPPSTSTTVPSTSSGRRVVMAVRETEEMLASASPRKPKEAMW